MIQAFIEGIVIPFLLSLGLVLGFSFFRTPAWVLNVLLVGTYLLSHYLLAGLPPFPPLGGTESVFYLLALSPLFSLFTHLGRWREIALVFSSCLIAMALVLLPMIKSEAVSESLGLIAIMACFSLLIILGFIKRVKSNLPSPWLDPIVINLSLLALAVVLFIHSSALMAQLAGVLWTISAARILAQGIFKIMKVNTKSECAVFPLPLLTFGFASLLAAGIYFLDLTVWSSAVLALPLASLALFNLRTSKP